MARLESQVGQSGVAALHMRAALWYRAEGLYTEAIDHLLRAGLLSEAADWLEDGLAEVAGRQAPQTLRRWVERLGEALLGTRPRLAIMAAWALITTGAVQAEHHFAAAVDSLSVAERALRGTDDAATTGLLAVVRTALAPWAPLRQLPVCTMQDVSYAAQFGQEARRLLPAESRFWRSVVSNSLGTVYLRSGDVAGAAKAFGEAARLGLESADRAAAVAALRQQGELLTLLGQLQAAAEVYQEALRVGAQPGLGPVYVGLGRLRYEWNDLPGAEAAINEALRLEATPEALFVLAQVKQATGDVAAARALVAEGGALLGSVCKLRAATAAPWPEGVRVLLALGDVAEARRWVEAGGVELDRTPLLWRAPEYLALARVLVAEGAGEGALPLLRSLRAVAAGSGCRGIEAECWVVESLIREGAETGPSPAAPSCIQEALALTAAAGYVRLYADPPIPRILAQIAGDWRRSKRAERSLLGYLERLLAMLGEEQPALAEPLTERELQILRLVAAGSSNQDVAKALFMGVSTVKWHLININSKLDAKNRTEAVARARELGVI
jgi:LuxR family maltose regulon positive regulatory protein